MTKFIYDDCAICYLDILGFKELLKDVGALSKIIEILEDVLHVVRPRGYEISANWKIEYLQISDGILIWCKMPSSLYGILFLKKVLGIVGALKSLSIPLRGCISFGSHYFADGILVSPAFVEAYTVESTLAIHPRVLVATSFLIKLKELNDTSDKRRTNVFNNLVRKDSDGLYYFNYLPFLTMVPTKYKGEEAILFKVRMLNNHKKMIEKGLLNTNLKIAKKYNWLKKKHNNFVRYQVCLSENQRNSLLVFAE